MNKSQDLFDNEQFRSIFELVPNGMLLLGTDGKFLKMNRSFCQMLGYSEEELMSMTFRDITYNEDLSASNDWIDKLLRNEIASIDFDKRYVHKSGKIIWGKVRAILKCDINGLPLYFITHIQDITEHKLSEKELFESEEKYSSLFNAMNGGVALHEVIYNNENKPVDYRIIDFNPAFEKHTEIQKEKAKNQLASEFYGTGVAPFLDIYSRVAGTGEPNQFETYFPPLEKYFNISVFSPMKGRFATIFNDITRRKLVDEKLIKSEKELKRAQQIAHIGSWHLDVETNKVTWSEELYRMHGFDPMLPPPPNTEYMKLFTPESWKILSSSLANTTTKGIPYELELNTVKKDGSWGWIWVRGEAVKDSKGKIVELWGATQDITDRKHFETDLKEAKKHAEESDQLKTSFLANMSHEIRTPMNSILGFSEMLKEPNLTGDQQQEYIRIIEEGGTRMLNILNNIIDISRIESGQMNVRKSETNVNDQLDYVYNLFKREVELKGLKFTLNKENALSRTRIHTDKDKLIAILTNLIKNALKYTKQGTIEFGYLLKESEIIFFVQDTGIGIDDERKEAIFERFIQAEITNSRTYQGAGLGLSISKSFIEMLGGRIWLESQEGVGSTFYFTIPYQSKSKKEVVPENRKLMDIEMNKDNKLKILIVEDDQSSEILMNIQVEAYAKEILKTNNGVEAVEICRKHPDLDLVLMDILLPEIDGYEAVRQIRSFNTEVIIIAQTAYALTGDREKALEAGCNDYISKPVKKAEILKMIRKYIKN